MQEQMLMQDENPISENNFQIARQYDAFVLPKGCIRVLENLRRRGDARCETDCPVQSVREMH